MTYIVIIVVKLSAIQQPLVKADMTLFKAVSFIQMKQFLGIRFKNRSTSKNTFKN